MTITTVELLAEWERLENAFHDNLPSQGECGDPSHGKALWQFVYDNSDTLRTLISNLVKENERLREAAKLLRDEISATEEHGDGAAEEFCPICQAIEKLDTALRSNLDKEEGDNGPRN